MTLTWTGTLLVSWSVQCIRSTVCGCTYICMYIQVRTCFLLCYVRTYVRNCTCRGLGYSAELRRYINVICIDAFKTPFTCIWSLSRGELTELLPTLTFITWVVRVYVHTYVIKCQSRGVWCLWDLGCEAEATRSVQMLCLTTGVYCHTHSAHHMWLRTGFRSTSQALRGVIL